MWFNHLKTKMLIYKIIKLRIRKTKTVVIQVKDPKYKSPRTQTLNNIYHKNKLENRNI